MTRRWLLALVRLIRRGRTKEEKRLKLCGSCPYYNWWSRGCSLRGTCIYASGGGPPFKTRPYSNVNDKIPVLEESNPLTKRKESESFRDWLARQPAKKSKMDPIHLKHDELEALKPKKRAPPSVPSRGGNTWSELFPDPLPEERRIILWNSHITQKVREFAALLEEDAWRRDVEAVLVSYGIEFNSDEVADDAEEVEAEDEEVVAEEEQSVEQLVEQLTKQLKEFHNGEVHGRAVEGDGRTPAS